MTDVDEFRQRRDEAFAKICNYLAFERSEPVTRAQLEAEAKSLIEQATGANGNDEGIAVTAELKALLMEYCVSDVGSRMPD